MEMGFTSESRLAVERAGISWYFSTLAFCIPDFQLLRDKVCTFSKHRTLRLSHTEIRLIKGITKDVQKRQEPGGAQGRLPTAEQVSPPQSSEPPGHLPGGASVATAMETADSIMAPAPSRCQATVWARPLSRGRNS